MYGSLKIKSRAHFRLIVNALTNYQAALINRLHQQEDESLKAPLRRDISTISNLLMELNNRLADAENGVKPKPLSEGAQVFMERFQGAGPLKQPERHMPEEWAQEHLPVRTRSLRPDKETD